MSTKASIPANDVNDHDGGTPPENMSVSELRIWLKQMEKKHQDHYHQNLVVRRRSPTQTYRRVSVRDRICGMERVPEEVDENKEVARMMEEENQSQQENFPVSSYSTTYSRESSSAKRFGTFSHVPRRLHHSNMMNRVSSMKEKASQGTEKPSIASPPFLGDHDDAGAMPVQSKHVAGFDDQLSKIEVGSEDLCLAN